MKVRVSLDLEGELAQAFLKELGDRVSQGGSPSRADLARILTAEALRARGHSVEAPETSWGGHRVAGEVDDQGQLVGIGVG